MIDVLELIALGATMSLGTAILALWGMAKLSHPHHDVTMPEPDTAPLEAAYVFDGPRLIDATEPARVALSFAPDGDNDILRLVTLLMPRFPEIGRVLKPGGQRRSQSILSRDKSECATITRDGPRIRVVVTPSDADTRPVVMDRTSQIAIEHELQTLRSTTDHAPFLVWRENADGQITWVNRAYLDVCEARAADDAKGIWPPQRLFDLDMNTLRQDEDPEPRRIQLPEMGDQPAKWYQCHFTFLHDDLLISAIDVDAVVAAEDSLRTFVQTLSKTFAHLPIGLAVFSKDRRLALFNPALTDLTTIAPDKLVSRPSLFSFFDMLRDKQMMPEPKNYKTWRDQIIDLEASAANGTYLDTWHLPYGRTFRVTGRPQPDGAVALLFEDISAEISLTRRFRTELETGQAVLDSLDRAVAVFAPNGVLTMSNAAYDELWSLETREGIENIGIIDAMRSWISATKPNSIWGDVRDFVQSEQARADWSGTACMQDGRTLECQVKPLTGGATLVTFRPEDPVAIDTRAEPQKLLEDCRVA